MEPTVIDTELRAAREHLVNAMKVSRTEAFKLHLYRIVQSIELLLDNPEEA